MEVPFKANENVYKGGDKGKQGDTKVDLEYAEKYKQYKQD